MLDENVSDQVEVKSLFKSNEEREPVASSEKNVWVNRILVTLVWGSIISGCLYLAGGGEVEVSSVAVVVSTKSQIFDLLIGDLTSWPEWNPAVSGIPADPAEIKEGQSYEVTTSLLGIPITETWTVDYFGPENGMTFNIESSIRTAVLSVSVESDPGGAALNLYYKTSYKGLGRLAATFILEDAMLDKMATNIRRLADDFPPPPPHQRGGGRPR
ncbi:MAG: hypothetical protein HOB73_10815 [Planctomycetaceae bacterium]|jgi:hypothetical protein|nr:hypothetical protein [Planctomycetaceae bacterium]